MRAALAALDCLDREHAAVYFQLIYEALREPVQQAPEKMIMERQTELKGTLPPFLQRFVLEGEAKGEARGEVKGKLEGRREALLRLMSRMGLVLTAEERARVDGCSDLATLDRWLDNVVGAGTASDVLS